MLVNRCSRRQISIGAIGVIGVIGAAAAGMPASAAPPTPTPALTTTPSGRSPIDMVAFKQLSTWDEGCTIEFETPNEKHLHCESFPATTPKDGMQIVIPAVAAPASYTLSVTAHPLYGDPVTIQARPAAGPLVGPERGKFWEQHGQQIRDIDCATLSGNTASTMGCEFGIRTDNLIENSDLTVSVVYHPADTPTCPTHTAYPPPPLPPATSHIGDPWEQDFEGPYSFEDACARMDTFVSPLFLRIGPVYYVAHPHANGYLHLPPNPNNERISTWRNENRQVDLLISDGSAPARLYSHPSNFPGSILPGQTLWINPHSLRTDFASSPADASIAIASLASTTHCSEKDTCVLGVAGPPDRNGGIPLSRNSIHPEDRPNTIIDAPPASIKNLILIAPTDNSYLKSVTVNTRLNKSSTITEYTVFPGQMFVVPDNEKLISIVNNTR